MVWILNRLRPWLMRCHGVWFVLVYTLWMVVVGTMYMIIVTAVIDYLFVIDGMPTPLALLRWLVPTTLIGGLFTSSMFLVMRQKRWIR